MHILNSMKRLLAALLFLPAAIAFGQQADNKTEPCQSPESKAFDFMLGEWQEPETGHSLKVKKILKGCAIQEFWSGAFEAILLRSYDAARQKWFLTFLSDSPMHQVWEGRKENGQWRFYREWTLNGTPIISRTFWTLLSEGQMDKIVEQSRDNGKTWKLHDRASYRRRSQ
ncbi:MAG: hypothetical protein L0229_29800 [Blastocatellia bacterium]|nr:hypothetical protein [Blastocatellia bacterium]